MVYPEPDSDSEPGDVGILGAPAVLAATEAVEVGILIPAEEALTLRLALEMVRKEDDDDESARAED